MIKENLFMDKEHRKYVQSINKLEERLMELDLRVQLLEKKEAL